MKTIKRLLFCCFFVGILGAWYAFPTTSKKILIVPFPGMEGESLFELDDPFYNRDNARVSYYMLKQGLMKLGYTVKSVRSPEEFESANYIICFDVPLESPEIMKALPTLPKEKLFLFIVEPPTVKPYNFIIAHHVPFGTIFTLLDDVVDHQKYVKFYEPQPSFKMKDDLKSFEQRKLCTMLAGNKASAFPLQLYSERRKVINFFEELGTDEFDFYGLAWPADRYKNYRGFTKSKLECLNNYRFCICYENMRDVKGYITGEKLFFCLIAGCIPIYWGAPNITDYVPKNCFIDRRNFKDEKEMYAFMKNVTKEQYDEYLKNIKIYLDTPQARQFSAENFVHIVLERIKPGYNRSLVFTPEQQAMLLAIQNL